MYFSQGVPCGGNSSYTVKLTVQCDELGSNDNPSYVFLNESDSCNIKLSVNAPAGCPKACLTCLIDQYFFLFTLIFLCAGLFMTFYGLQFMTRVLFVFGSLAVGTIALVINIQYINVVDVHLPSYTASRIPNLCLLDYFINFIYYRWICWLFYCYVSQVLLCISRTLSRWYSFLAYF